MNGLLGGGGQRVCCPPPLSNYWGGLAPPPGPPLPTPMFLLPFKQISNPFLPLVVRFPPEMNPVVCRNKQQIPAIHTNQSLLFAIDMVGCFRFIDSLKQYSDERFWLVGCYGLNGPLRRYFSLYRAVSQREGERKEK